MELQNLEKDKKMSVLMEEKRNLEDSLLR